MITDILKIKHPIIQAPMALSDSPALAAAVSNQGGLGSFGAGTLSPQQIRDKIKEIRALTNNPFAINLFSPIDTKKYTENEIQQAVKSLNYFRQKLGLKDVDHVELQSPSSFDERLAVILEEKVPVFSFTFGILSKEVIQKIKSHNISVIGTATTVREAQLLETNGVDMVVAQGYEAGGHRGTDLKVTNLADALIGTMALVPQVVDAIKIPVIASGGIMDGRGIVAALALGAAGIQMGTAFLCCPESNIHQIHRKSLLESTDESTRLTTVFTGRMARSLKNAFLLEMEKNHFPILDMPIQGMLVKDIREAAQKQNNLDYMSLWAGQASRLCREIPAAQLFNQFISEAQEILSNHSLKNFSLAQ
ncbi:MAG: nitronate monooxygenase [Gammaproteobacteria bacterium]|nr:nitronate monooxygenase [Gammaproteobacteria bacterium]